MFLSFQNLHLSLRISGTDIDIQICATGGWVVFLIQSRHGLGKHEETISRADMVTFMHAGFWQSVISATFALAFLKLSIGFNLLRLSTSKWYTRSLWATIGKCRQINYNPCHDAASNLQGTYELALTVLCTSCGHLLLHHGSHDIFLPLQTHGRSLGFLPQTKVLLDEHVCHVWTGEHLVQHYD